MIALTCYTLSKLDRQVGINSVKRFIALDMTHPDYEQRVWIIYDQVTQKYGFCPLGFDIRYANYFVESPFSADIYASHDEAMRWANVLNSFN